MSGKTKYFGAKDMTEGSPIKKIALFALPMLLGNFAQQLYNTVDSVIVGKYVGDNALAAVGGSGPVGNILIILFVGISTGAGIMVAQYFGAKNKEKLASSVGTCLTLTMIVTLIMMVVGNILAGPLLRMLNTPDEIYGMCKEYLSVLFWGIGGLAYYNILAGILRGLGDSLSALKYLIVSTVLNVGLDLLFVAQFNMGVRGVAIATVIAQLLSALLAFRKILGMRDAMHLQLHHFKPDKECAFRLFKLGMPSGAAQAVIACSSLLVQSLANSFGPVFMACNTIVMRVDSLVMMPNFTFGNSMTTYTGQNIGAGKMDRVEEGIKAGLKMAVGTAIVLVGFILIFGRTIMGFFTDTPELVDMSYNMMKIISLGYIAFAVTQCLSGVMRGAGDATAPMWISFVITLGIRVPLAYLFAYLSHKPESLFQSLLVAWVMGAVINIIVFRRGRWRKTSKFVHKEVKNEN